MLAPERQRHILARLHRREAVRIPDLAAALQVSEMTIRRDIDALDAAGSLQKVHGGAMALTGPGSVEPAFDANAARHTGAKTAIASAAAALVRPKMTIALTGGTTTFHLAQQLRDVPALTIVTNSLRVADVFGADAADTTVILTGGERTPSEALVGPVATGAIRSLHVDACFMGVRGIHPRYGLTSPNLQEADTNRAFVASANRLVVVADASKFGTVALAAIAGMTAVDTLVTDRAPDDPAYRKHGTEIRVAAPE